MSKNKPIRWLFLSLSLVSLLFVFSNNIVVNKAEDKADEAFQKAVKDYAGDSLFDKILNLARFKQKEEEIQSVLRYLLIPGTYMDDVTNATIIEDLDNTVYKEEDGKKSLCKVSETQPQNLLNHNCDLPTVSTAIAQKVFSTFSSYGIQNGETTPAKSNWGIPSGLPDDKVPSNEASRTSKYTGLELFGYNLQFVNYTGEWDDIQVSTEARLLANYGFLDRVALNVNSIWNGAKGGFTAVIKKFDWNPIKYAMNIINGVASNVLWTAIDTSDYNIAASHAWTRPEFANTLYNVYYMNTKDISEKANAEYLRQIKELLAETLGNHPKTKDLFDVDYGGDEYPKFAYDPTLTKKVPRTDDSGQLVKDENGQTLYDDVPVPESEQLSNWRATAPVQSFFGKASNAEVPTCAHTTTGAELQACYKQGYDNRVKAVVQEYESNMGERDIEKLALKIEALFKKRNIYSNPATGIAHYVCGTEEGKPLDPIMENYQYVYLAENTPDGESLNPACAPVRPSVKGGWYGYGNSKQSDDSRWQQFNFVRTHGINMTNGGSFWNNVAQAVTKLTITIVDFSYSNIIEVLEIDTIVESMIISFRDTIFYPLLVLIIAIAALLIFLEIFKKGQMANTFKALVGMVATFSLGVIILMKPGMIVKLVDEVPSKIDNAILDFMMNVPGTTEDEVCSSTGGDKTALRTLECKIWRINIFTPWLMGQWGTTYENLNSSMMSNSNTALVGNASVNMGGGYIANNWALYQLEKTKSGTLTEDFENSNITSRALYKIVDLQYGPKGGASSDDTYAKQWSGINGRGFHRLGSAITSIALAIPIIGMSIAKLEMAFTFALLLMWLPIVLLFGILPKGRMKLIAYGQKLLSVFVKRFIITIIMSFTLYFITLALDSSTSYTTIFIGSVIISFASILYWKDLVNLFNITSESGAGMLSSQIGGFRKTIADSNILPPALRLRFNATTRGVRDMAIGASVGAASGVIQSIKDSQSGYKRTVNINGKQYRSSAVLVGMIDGGSHGLRRALNFVRNDQRRKGYGLYDNLKQSYEAGQQRFRNEFRLDGNQRKHDVDSIKNLLSARVVVKEKEYSQSIRNFNQSYNQLLDLAHQRNIPLTEDGHIDFNSIQDLLFDENGNPNKDFRDHRFDNKFISQVKDVAMKSVEMNNARVEYERNRFANDYLQGIIADGYMTSDAKTLNLLSSYSNALNTKKVIGQDENGNPIMELRTVEEAADIFVDNMNSLNKYESQDDRASTLAVEHIYNLTDKISRVKEDYEDYKNGNPKGNLFTYVKEQNTSDRSSDKNSSIMQLKGLEKQELQFGPKESFLNKLKNSRSQDESFNGTSKSLNENPLEKIQSNETVFKKALKSNLDVKSETFMNVDKSVRTLLTDVNMSQFEIDIIKASAIQEANNILTSAINDDMLSRLSDSPATPINENSSSLEQLSKLGSVAIFASKPITSQPENSQSSPLEQLKNTETIVPDNMRAVNKVIADVEENAKSDVEKIIKLRENKVEDKLNDIIEEKSNSIDKTSGNVQVSKIEELSKAAIVISKLEEPEIVSNDKIIEKSPLEKIIEEDNNGTSSKSSMQDAEKEKMQEAIETYKKAIISSIIDNSKSKLEKIYEERESVDFKNNEIVDRNSSSQPEKIIISSNLKESYKEELKERSSDNLLNKIKNTFISMNTANKKNNLFNNVKKEVANKKIKKSNSRFETIRKSINNEFKKHDLNVKEKEVLLPKRSLNKRKKNSNSIPQNLKEIRETRDNVITNVQELHATLQSLKYVEVLDKMKENSKPKGD